MNTNNFLHKIRNTVMEVKDMKLDMTTLKSKGISLLDTKKKQLDTIVKDLEGSAYEHAQAIIERSLGKKMNTDLTKFFNNMRNK